MTAFLISFRAETYCQGWEWGHHTLLVYAYSYGEACEKIKDSAEYKNSAYFQNLTIL